VYPRKSNFSSGKTQTRVFESFTVNFSFDIIFCIVARACSAPVEQQMTRSSA
jgi:hypothetical protein